MSGINLQYMESFKLVWDIDKIILKYKENKKVKKN